MRRDIPLTGGTDMSQQTRQPASPPIRGKDEAGVTLILALVFLITIGVTLAALLDLATNDVLNTSNLKSQSSLEYAADGATDATIQWVQYGGRTSQNCSEGTPFCLYLFNGNVVNGNADTTPGGSVTTPALCLPQGITQMALPVGGPSIAVYCLNDGNSSIPSLSSTASSAVRGVYFYACTPSNCLVDTTTAGGTSANCGAGDTCFTCSSASGCVQAPPSGPYPDNSPILQAHVQFNDYSPTTPGAILYGSQMTILSWVVETANN
jgi:hypothetical protein